MSDNSYVIETREDGSVLMQRREYINGYMKEWRKNYSDVSKQEQESEIRSLGITDTEKANLYENLEEAVERFCDSHYWPLWIDGKCFKEVEPGLLVESKTYQEYFSDTLPFVNTLSDEEKLAHKNRDVIDVR